ncbi:prepilin-type N-terminal cleavage/methylation domain-containing protein [Neobacillus sp. NPDC093182]|uniref:prepilin-type N-terminal cleavage/methylation domain-containing protein n=1 Tax=Neobacillus sp. NPDC093182 TaxID=3364297 RepID=UPI00380F9A77
MLKKLGSKLKEQKGFTLIELLAVIVILGIIAAIAIPAITSVIGKSDNKAKVQEGIQIINAAKLYVADTRPAAGDIDKVQLVEYLDKVQDDTYEVAIGLTASGKYTYTLKTHEAVALADQDDPSDGATEQELLEYTK